MKINLPKLKKPSIKIPKGKKLTIQIGTFLGIIVTISISVYSFKYITSLQRNYSELKNEKEVNLVELERIGEELEQLKNEDQYKINQDLKENIENMMFLMHLKNLFENNIFTCSVFFVVNTTFDLFLKD